MSDEVNVDPADATAAGGARGESDAIMALEGLVGTDSETEDGTRKTEDGTEAVTETEAETEIQDLEVDHAAEGKLTPEAKAIIQQRIDKEVAKRKRLESDLAEAKAQAEQAAKAADAESMKAAAALAVTPEYLQPGEAKTVQEYERWKEIKRWCSKNRDGFEGDGKSFSADQVAAYREQADEALMELAPEASVIRKRAQREMAADLAAGRRLRLERAKAAAAVKKGAEVPPVKVPVRAGAAAAAGGGPIRRGPSSDRFRAAGGSLEAAERELEEMLG